MPAVWTELGKIIEVDDFENQNQNRYIMVILKSKSKSFHNGDFENQNQNHDLENHFSKSFYKIIFP